MKTQASSLYELNKAVFEEPPFLSETEYARAVKKFIRVCVDVVLFDGTERVVYLAKRVISPRRWWLVGGMVEPGELEVDAAVRYLKEDLALRMARKHLETVSKFISADYYVIF